MALNHTVTGSVNYTVVGTPTIVDGVVSGFSADDYLYISNQVDWKQVTDIVFKVRIPSSALGTNSYFNITYCGLALFTYSGSTKFQYTGFNANGMGDLFINKDLDADTWYWIKYSSDGTTSTASWSTDGINYTPGQSKQTSTITSSPGGITIGKRSTDRIFPGEIDLNETYIKVNGQAWFGVCPVEVKHIDYGTSVGYTKVGSPTISNGVVSGFSGSNYLQLSSGLNLKNFTEAIFKIKIDSSTFDGDNINFYLFQETTRLQVYFNKYQNSGVNFIVYAGDSNHTRPARDFPIDTWFYLKLTYNGTTFEVYRSSDRTNWGTAILSFALDWSSISDAITTTIGINTYSATNYFRGQVDLNETYIKVNNKLWFYRPSTNYLVKDDKLVFADSGLYLTGPNTYTKVGTPTIVDGVVSGFNDSNHIETVSSSQQGDLEIVMSLKTGDISTNSGTRPQGNQVLFQTYTGSVYNTIALFAGKLDLVGVSSFGNTIFQANTNYKIRFVYTLATSNLEAFIFTNGNWVSQGNKTVSDFYGKVIFGDALNTTERYFLGGIDLNETYVKVDGSLWFYGKNYASQNIAPVPAGLTYGNTTTSAIGWVDMRTQAFTPAPSGATIGRDE